MSLLEEHLRADVKNFLQEVHGSCSDLREIIHCDSEKRDSGFSSKEHLNPLSALPMKMLFTSLSNLEQDKTLCAKDENTL